MTNLPSWLQELLPVKKEPYWLTWLQDQPALIHPDGTQELLGDWHAANDRMAGLDVKFDESVADHLPEGGELTMGFLSFPTLGGQFSTLRGGLDDNDRERMLTQEVEHSLEAAKLYREDPTHFYRAYRFLESHMAFWIRRVDEPTWYWDTTKGLRGLWQHVGMDNGQVIFALEHGGAADCRTQTTHDCRLDTYGGTYEEAIINLAALVAVGYTDDGVYQEDEDLPEPEWMAELQERVAEAKEASLMEDQVICEKILEATPEDED